MKYFACSSLDDFWRRSSLLAYFSHAFDLQDVVKFIIFYSVSLFKIKYLTTMACILWFHREVISTLIVLQKVVVIY